VSGPALPSLRVEPLTAESFAAFGEVIHIEAASLSYSINEGTAQRLHALGHIDCSADGGQPLISLVRAQPRPMPFAIRMLERHPLGSQAFIPLGKLAYLVVVAESPDAMPRAFLASDGQGVNFRRGCWHHPLLALDAVSDFIVVDRDGPGDNCEVATLSTAYQVEPERPELGYCD
jgi:ureidoglycolate lyase